MAKLKEMADMAFDIEAELRHAQMTELISEARSAGVPEEELQPLEQKISDFQERSAKALQAVNQAKDDCKSVDVTSITAVQEAKEKLMDALAAARECGCSDKALQQADAMRKRLHNIQEDLKGAIRIFCRVRPLNQKERDSGDHSVVAGVDSTTLVVNTGRDPSNFAFDAVFLPGTQEEIFEDLRHLVQSVLDGYNITIFAYGQTGAGKTHTMYGTPDDEGTAPRTIRELYGLIEQYGGRHEHTVHASMMELYKNELVDLLLDRDAAAAAAAGAPGAPATRRSSRQPRRESGMDPLDIGQVPELPRLSVQTEKTGEVTIENLTEEFCPSWQDLRAVLDRGTAHRHTAATAMNANSSRSHLLLMVRVVCTNHVTGQRLQGKIMMCDLAGSERIKKTLAEGERQKEAIEINKSLTAIGDVVEALTTGKTHVPYKNHKLTQVLQDSLGGTSKTLMFVNCSPASSNLDETVNAMKFATRLKKAPRKLSKGGIVKGGRLYAPPYAAPS